MKKSYREKFIVAVRFSLALLAGCTFFKSNTLAQMSRMNEAELLAVSAQSGITMYIGNSGATVAADAIKYWDSDTVGSLELTNFTIDGDGAGGAFSFDTPATDPNTIDSATDGDGRTYLNIVDSTHTSPRYYHADSITFCGQDLGELNIDNVTIGPTEWRMSSHGDGTAGIDQEYLTAATIEKFEYLYSPNTSNALSLSGIHLVGSGTTFGNYNDPTGSSGDPWDFSAITKFRIGDIEGDYISPNDTPPDGTVPNAATIDVGTNATPQTSVFMNLPMEGSLWIEDVSFSSAVSFGPCVLDGIEVHRLAVQLTSP